MKLNTIEYESIIIVFSIFKPKITFKRIFYYVLSLIHTRDGILLKQDASIALSLPHQTCLTQWEYFKIFSGKLKKIGVAESQSLPTEFLKDYAERYLVSAAQAAALFEFAVRLNQHHH